VRRIGIYGGSFDPVHLGHLLVAQAACEELQLDRLFFVPAARSPFKLASDPAPGPVRARLLRMALAAMPWCEVDTQEIEREGVSFAVETLRSYASRFQGAELHYLVGADHVPLLSRWFAADELARLACFVVLPRPGENDVEIPAPFRGTTLRGWPLRISSSEIRARIKAGRSVDHLLPPAVAEAIRNYPLYL
jgi:nicotinate-nucleotide adenylyltransferase